MRIVFAGTPAFAACALQALLRAGHEIVAVLSQPDRPAGRGLKLVAGEVKQLAQQRGLAIFQPQTLGSPGAQERLRAAGADVMVVAAYGLILPRAVLEAFPLGCINIHASLLPRWRGAAPIQRAILAGDNETGICLMRMEKGLDTGPVYLMERIPIAAADTAGSLHDKLAVLGARSIVEALPKIANGELPPVPQADVGATYAQKIAKDEARIDWRREAAQVTRQVRAFNPFPGAHSILRGEPVKIWCGVAVSGGGGKPGAVLQADPQGIVVACADGGLRVTELQRAGGKRLSAADFLRGFAFVAGEHFGC